MILISLRLCPFGAAHVVYRNQFKGSLEMALHWYVLRSKPNKEEALWREIRARQYEAFFPQIRVQPVNPRSRKTRPYFPGYIFILSDLQVTGLSTLTWIPYSCGLVSFGTEPPSVPDELIIAIKRQVDGINTRGGELHDGLRAGEAVTIQAGPFQGYQAIFDSRLPGRERARVLLKLLSQQQVPIELPVGQIEPLKSSLKIDR